MPNEERHAANFIEEFIEEDLKSGRFDYVRTRFPPEPNGFLHIGHAKALCIDFGIAEKYNARCNLRFDDTNPTKEETAFVEGIQRDIEWLGYHWSELHFASDFFEKLYEIACDLIRKGVAYVDDQSPEEMRKNRGTLTQPGVNSPYRDRSVEENLDLFQRMRAGEFPDGARVLRAKIDMASPNVLMRDPTLYRILRCHHHRTGDDWCIYPMYDFQHPLQDALEGITHSLCSLEYEIHRPLYDWVVRQAGFSHPPRQIEFARLNITRTVMSKRYLRRFVEEGVVSGWDDPRMPTLVAMRRRGYPASAVKDFMSRVGVSKADSTVDGALLEHCVREALGEIAPRAMAILNPIPVTFSNWDAEKVDLLEVENHPDHPEMGTHTVRFGKRIFIDREDFMEDPPKKFFRLAPGREVRLKGAYIIRCDEVVKNAEGEIVEILCTVDLDSRSGSEGANRKIKGKTLHWLNVEDAKPCEFRLYEPILNEDTPEQEEEDELQEETEEKSSPSFMDKINPNSLTVVRGLCEPLVAEAKEGDVFQFLRVGYFCKDRDSSEELPVYNRTVALKDAWAKEKGK
ncbi:MAG TPA: glutamine--tRNA ligase/YqeY domain fusion protein [Candidatus Pullichristensenella excrementigallinarum]|uniref:Glutamine--tRNA ligase n=1 Tax=Candidatus Pullichristensenella excrementigallinarum TaxID=2840907 RepID=A0A9D1LC89_9FIRM|nr:glutamine--tRNA ligase/YqeY domain fusion protein [Candidatus Pullichristensenella excrementigallinarum]